MCRAILLVENISLKFPRIKFKMIHTSRQTHFEIIKSLNYKVGNNVISNRLTCLNKKIPLEMLNLTIENFKIRCKNMFLV